MQKYIKIAGWLILLVPVLFSSCKTTKYLQHNEILLRKQKIKIHPTEKIEGYRALSTEITNQLKQKTNRKLFGLFYTRMWLNHVLKDPPPKSGFRKWLYGTVSEPPVLLDSIKAEETRIAMEGVLFNNGFFDGIVEYNIKPTGKQKADISYNVFPESGFKIRNISFHTKDSVMLKYLPEINNTEKLIPGKRLNSADYELEAIRLVRFFRNNGFASFNKTHISNLLIDTIGTSTDITIEILPPNQSTHHQQYTINNITVFLDYTNANADEAPAMDTTINNVRLLSYTSPSSFKPAAIQKLIYINKAEIYNQDDIDFTNKRLSSLPCFKFIKIKTEIDTEHQDKLNVIVLLTPADKYSSGIDYDLNWETNTFLNQALIGTALSFNHKSKNIFKGGEVMNAAIEAGIAINPSLLNKNFINTLDLKISNEFKLPKFNGFFGLYRALTRLPGKAHPIIGNKMFEDMQKLGTSSMLASYSYSRIVNQYDIQALNLGYTINYQQSNLKKYQITHLGVSLLNTKLDPFFDSLISANTFLKRSLAERQLFTGILFRELSFTYVKPSARWGEDWFGQINTELSGLEVWAVNSTVNLLRKSDVNWSRSLKFAQYFKLESEGRYTKRYSKNLALATRLYSGIIIPFGFSSQTPYVKQFFSGGPNSLRAWRIRELGPGNAQPPENVLTYYQTGNFKLEANAELRFPIFWYLKGAIFLDAGNVWDFEKSTYGDQAVLKWNFYKQIALGTGVGIRADFDFFQIRFDAGLKLNDPGKWVFNPFKMRLSDFNPNIAIGYPF